MTEDREAFKREQEAKQAAYAAARREHGRIVQRNSEARYGKGHASKK